MRRATNLESRLSEWAKEHPWAPRMVRTQKIDDVAGLSYGPSPLASLMKWRGRSPFGFSATPVSTATDEVQQAIIALEAQPKGYTPAQVLKIEYTLEDAPREEKRQKLARLGMSMGDVRYSQHLRLAKVHVAAWIRVPFEEPMTDEARADFLAYIEGVD